MKEAKLKIKYLIKRIPVVNRKLSFYKNIIEQLSIKLDGTEAELKNTNRSFNKLEKELWISPNHFYSPVTHGKDGFVQKKTRLPGIDLNITNQLKTLKECTKFYTDFPYLTENDSQRYTFNNNQFGHSDALFLYCMIRLLKPHRIIEVGSGFSSGIMLDLNTKTTNNRMVLSFIDPFADRLRGVLKKDDDPVLIEDYVQNVPVKVFQKLEKNDILFIDSSHVSKTGSDVNFLYFEVLPTLKPGVIIHIHDVFYPFEYPESWIKQGRSWNEQYLLRALLLNNPGFEIILWPNYLHQTKASTMSKLAPLSRENFGGSI